MHTEEGRRFTALFHFLTIKKTPKYMIFQSLHFLGISFIFFLVSRSRCQVFPRPYARIARQSCSTEQPDSTDAFVTSLMHTTNTDLGL